LLFGLIIELATVFELASIFYPSVALQMVSDIEAGFFLLLGPLSPTLIVAVFSIPFAQFALWEIFRKTKETRWEVTLKPVRLFFTRSKAALRSQAEAFSSSLKMPRLLLGVAVVSSIFLTTLPYRPEVDPSGSLVGVDSPQYANWLGQMLARTPVDAIVYAFSVPAMGSRPLFLLPLYAVAILGSIQPQTLIQYVPAILGPLLCISTYLFVWSGQRSERIAGLVSILAAFSFNASVGMWGGYYANWFALSEGYIFFSVLLRWDHTILSWKYWALMALSLTLIFTHPWTWAVIIATTLVFLGSMTRLPKARFRLAVFSIIAIVGLVGDILKSVLFGPTTLAADIATKSPIFGLSELIGFWPNVMSAMRDYYGGLLGNSVILVFAAFGMLSLRFGDKFERLLMAWVVTSAIPFALFASFHQTRLIYDLPIPVLAAFGLLMLTLKLGSKMPRLSYLFLALAVLSQASYGLRAMYQLP